MNGYELCKKAYLRLGTENSEEIVLRNSDSLRDTELINQIADDLRLKPIGSLSDELHYTREETEAVCSGLIMLLSLCGGERAKNELYTSVYNAKRAALLGGISKIEDTLPVSESGDI